MDQDTMLTLEALNRIAVLLEEMIEISKENQRLYKETDTKYRKLMGIPNAE